MDSSAFPWESGPAGSNYPRTGQRYYAPTPPILNGTRPRQQYTQTVSEYIHGAPNDQPKSLVRPNGYYTPPGRHDDSPIYRDEWLSNVAASPTAIFRPPTPISRAPPPVQREAQPTNYQPRAVNQGRPSQNASQLIRQVLPAGHIVIQGTEYKVIKELQKPNDDPSMMSDGVRTIQDCTGLLLVQKRIKMTDKSKRDRAEAEKKALFQIANVGGSRHINEVFRAVWDGKERHSNLLLEFCDEGALQSYIDSCRNRGRIIPETFRWRVLSQLAAALAMCHEGIRDPFGLSDNDRQTEKWNSIYHLDIKPANVFLSSKKLPGYENEQWPRVVLGDFGCCVTEAEEGRYGDDPPFGTPGWYSPENDPKLRNRYRTPVKFGKHTDIWQMGGVVQVMCTLLPEPEVFLDSSCGRGYSQSLNNAVEKCLSRHMNQRPLAMEVIQMCR